MASHFRPSRLRLLTVLGSVAALIVSSLLIAITSEARHRAGLMESAHVQARILAQTATAALSFEDTQRLGDYVAALRADPDVDAVGVYDESGRRVVGDGRLALPDRLPRLGRPADDKDRLAVLEPVTQNGTRLGTVYLRARPEPLERRLALYLGPGLLVVLAALMFAVMALDSRALVRANERLTAEIAEREKAEAALRQSQKLEAVGRLTGGIAHDFNNMLAIVLGNLDLLTRRFADGDPRMLRLANGAIEGATRASALTKRLLAFSRLQPLSPTTADIARSLVEISDMLRRTLGESIVVETFAEAGLWQSWIDLSQLEIAIVNLAINARDAMPEGGRLMIEAANTYLERSYASGDEDLIPGEYIMLTVTDTGSGMSPQIMAQVFEPFFTTKPPGVGTGLGLSQVHGFIKQSGGHVRLHSEVGVGTKVKLYLPRSREGAPSPAAKPQPFDGVDRQWRDITVLLVEDEAGVRSFAAEALGELGYEVIGASNARSALEMLSENPKISILLTDVIMPGETGRWLADRAIRLRPDLRVLFMTGYTRNAMGHNGVLDQGTHLINKPFSVRELGEKLDELLAP